MSSSPRNMIASAFFIFVLIGFVSSVPGKLPDNVPRCKRHDPNIDECLVKAIQASAPIILKGIPKLGLFPLDPLKITALDIEQGSGSISLDLKFRDFTLIGLMKVHIDHVKTDLDNYKIEIHASLNDPIEIESLYEAKGNILILPLAGNGTAHLTLDNVKAAVVLTGEELKKGGRSYMNLLDFKIDLETSRLHMNFQNLFRQNENLGENINDFLNENWKEIFQELYPAIREALGTAFKEIASRLLSKVPYDDIFLP